MPPDQSKPEETIDLTDPSRRNPLTPDAKVTFSIAQIITIASAFIGIFGGILYVVITFFTLQNEIKATTEKINRVEISVDDFTKVKPEIVGIKKDIDYLQMTTKHLKDKIDK